MHGRCYCLSPVRVNVMKNQLLKFYTRNANVKYTNIYMMLTILESDAIQK